MNEFYFYNDFYVSVEFSRISSEINNESNEYGSSKAQKNAAEKEKAKVSNNYDTVKANDEAIFI